MNDYAQVPWELHSEVIALVKQTKQRSRRLLGKTLEVLEIARATYHRWWKAGPEEPAASRSSPGSRWALLPEERQAIIDYALSHPQVWHRELAWKMLDEAVCADTRHSRIPPQRKGVLIVVKRAV